MMKFFFFLNLVSDLKSMMKNIETGDDYIEFFPHIFILFK